MTPYSITSVDRLERDLDGLLERVYVDEWGKSVTRGEPRAPGSERTLIALSEGQVVGTVRLRLSGELGERERVRFCSDHFERRGSLEQMAVGLRLAVCSGLRNSNLSVDLVRDLAALTVRLKRRLLFAACQPHLINFYRRLGFRSFNPVASDPRSGILAPLVLNLADRAGLAERGSPLAASAADEPTLAERLDRDIESAPGYPSRCRSALELWPDRGPQWSRIGVLSALGTEALPQILAGAQVIRCDPGALVIAKGQATRTLYVVLEGGLSLEAGAKGASVQRGGVAGELGYLLGLRQRDDVRAKSKGALLLALPVRAFANAGPRVWSQGSAFLQALGGQAPRSAEIPLEGISAGAIPSSRGSA